MSQIIQTHKNLITIEETITLHHLGITLHHLGIIDQTLHPTVGGGVDHQCLNRGLVTAQTFMEMGGDFLLTICLKQIMDQGEVHQTTNLNHQTTGLNHQGIGLNHQTTGLNPPTEDMVMIDPQEETQKIDMATTMLKVCHVHRCHHVRLPEVGVRQGTENV